MKRLVLSLACLPGLMLPAWAAPFTLINENSQPVRKVQPQDYFEPASLASWGQISTQPQDLAAVARETLRFLEQHPDNPAVTAGMLADIGVSLADVKKTLQKIVETVEADQRQGGPQRILNEAWLKEHFRLVRWKADRQGAAEHKVQVSDQRLRITKYVVFEAQGAAAPSASHCCALYALPDEEAGLSAEAAELKKAQLLRYRFTKQQVINGALKNQGVKPLVWLTRQGLEDALMQGSIRVRMPNGQQRMFNVHRNNGIAYDRSIKEPRQQKRYWYFQEVRGILGYGQDDKVKVEPAVTFAGDVYNLGLGKLIGIRYPLAGGKTAFRLGVLADTGGAFVPNLYQLDYLAGVFPDRAAYQKAVQALPTYAETFILIAR